MGGNMTPIIYENKHYTVMANDIVRGKQDMSLQEARILRLLITQVVKEDDDFKTFTCNIQDLADFLNIDSSNLYREIQTICTNLAQRIVKVSTGNPKQPWKVFTWISYAEYDGNGTITMRLSENIKPYILGLNAYFTQYQLENILEMKSFYSIRLYELLRSDFFKDDIYYLEYSIEFLRQFFDCENKHLRYNDFKKRVLQIAINEINLKSDIEIQEAIEIKKSRKVVAIKFRAGFNYTVDKKRNPWKYLTSKNT